MNQLLHEDAEKIVSAGIHAVLPDVAVIRALESYDFGTGGVYLVAAGKAAWQMAHAAVSCLGGRIRRGVVITKYGHSGGPLAGIACFEGGHPIPDEAPAGERGRRLRLCAISARRIRSCFCSPGGGSALLEEPLVPLSELQDITGQLLACGADIVEINTIRKRLI